MSPLLKMLHSSANTAICNLLSPLFIFLLSHIADSTLAVFCCKVEYTLSIDDVWTSLKLLLQQNRVCGVGGGGFVKSGKGVMEWQNVNSFVKQSPDISVSAYLRSAYKIKGLSEIASSRWSHYKYSTSLFLRQR
jgi:hypothetical protein